MTNSEEVCAKQRTVRLAGHRRRLPSPIVSRGQCLWVAKVPDTSGTTRRERQEGSARAGARSGSPSSPSLPALCLVFGPLSAWSLVRSDPLRDARTYLDSGTHSGSWACSRMVEVEGPEGERGREGRTSISFTCLLLAC